MSEYLRQKLRQHEGIRNRLYEDSEGVLTIGVGHNIQEKGISDTVVEVMLTEDIEEAVQDLKRILPEYSTLSEVRQYVLTNMIFNLGINRLRGFKRMLAAVRQGDFTEAAHEMVDSKWYRQVGHRAKELKLQMQHDSFDVDELL